MLSRGGRSRLAASPHEPATIDIANIVRNNIDLYGIRGEDFMRQKRSDTTQIHTHTFTFPDLPTALRYAKARIDDAIKVVMKTTVTTEPRIAAE